MKEEFHHSRLPPKKSLARVVLMSFVVVGAVLLLPKKGIDQPPSLPSWPTHIESGKGTYVC